ncbi:KTSC domain-containing protein [uncultured Clostridium sp.]|uniref:KTSC domain-containing protein n=1 Tax=uncultured Clostridium sp. TaxID=59620 RepID=UPI0026146C66|nr:KTSC domain-containing protein [uncultured Clostridium sp.]
MKTKQSVVSSQLKEIEYDTETSTLTVTFMQGRMYEYKDVPVDVFRKLIEA